MTESIAQAAADELANVQMVIHVEGRKVAQRFQRPMELVLFDPPNAIAVAEALTAAAFEADQTLKPVGPALKASLVEKHRDILIPRLALVISSMRENKLMTNGAIATKLMDIVCSSIFS